MASDLASGLFTLAGTVVGGAITFSGTYWTSRTERVRAEQTRSDQLADARRQAWVTFLTKLDTFVDHSLELIEALEDAAYRDELYKRYLDEWRSFVPTNAALQVGGPKEVAAKATALKKAIGDFSGAIDGCYRGKKKWGRSEEDKWKAVPPARLAFIEEAQKFIA